MMEGGVGWGGEFPNRVKSTLISLFSLLNNSSKAKRGGEGKLPGDCGARCARSKKPRPPCVRVTNERNSEKTPEFAGRGAEG